MVDKKLNNIFEIRLIYQNRYVGWDIMPPLTGVKFLLDLKIIYNNVTPIRGWICKHPKNAIVIAFLKISCFNWLNQRLNSWYRNLRYHPNRHWVGICLEEDKEIRTQDTRLDTGQGKGDKAKQTVSLLLRHVDFSSPSSGWWKTHNHGVRDGLTNHDWRFTKMNILRI